jgi:3-hydroxyacyl-CoA dehydrogenase
MITTQSKVHRGPAIRSVTVAGTGVLGAQIAFQTAYRGFNVVVYDINDDVLEKSKARFKSLQNTYIADLGASRSQVEETYSRITYSSHLGAAVKNADLLVEAIPEKLEIKQVFYEQLAKVGPKSTIFASNSSTMLPSQLAQFSGRPAQFLNLHFANQVWKHNIAEVMGHSGTDPAVFSAVIEFAKRIGMVPLPLHKEQPGYLLNSMLIPMLVAALELIVNDVADVDTIDKTWMIAMGTQTGPFAIMDSIGIATVYNITKNVAEKQGGSTQIRIVEYLKRNFIGPGKLGVMTGQGFYAYPPLEDLKAGFATLSNHTSMT